MKKALFPLAFAAVALTTACNDDEVQEIIKPDSEKEMISLSVGYSENDPATRAIPDPTYSGFTSATRILMRIQSDNKADATAKRYTKTLATAAAKESGKDYSKVNQTSYADAYKRYWDDAFGRNAQLSVFAVAVADKNDDALLPENSLKGSSTAWETTANDNKITWEVNNSSLSGKEIQDATVIANQDLVYSNNIKAGSTVGGRYVWNFSTEKYVPNIDEALTTPNIFTTDRMAFNCSSTTDPTAPGKFDKGHLVFNHALSRITVTIKNGTGFDATKFILDVTSKNGIQILGMNTKGDLDVEAGSWSNTVSKTITAQPTKVVSSTSASYTATMQMLPGYTFNNDDVTNVIQFSIDGNTYYITQDMIFEALTATGATLEGASSPITMLQGKNYNFTITINKTKVENLTASVAAWVPVTAADQTLYNSYVTLTGIKDLTGSACTNFDIYRMAVDAGKIYTNLTDPNADSYVNKDWKGNYAEHFTPTFNSEKNVWETTWLFEDNQTFYHFRTVNKGTTVSETNSNTDDYFTITSGAAESTDPHWGAPMITSAPLTYNPAADDATATEPAEGYSTSIYKAIGSTKDQIKIQELHMMSKIQIILKTVDGAAAVNLYNASGTTDDEKYPTISLSNFAKTGQVKMGSGLVTPNTDYVTTGQTITRPNGDSDWTNGMNATKEYTWCVVPQLVSRGTTASDCIGITIKTPDNNQYYIIEDLSKINVKETTTPITRWEPNHTYTYTFILSKKGIDNITCSVAEWVNVTAKDTELDLEGVKVQ